MAVTNEQIGKLMNTVRGVASSVYQNTVPEYTIDDVINNYGNLITSNSVIRNEFISILQNVIFYEYFAQHTFENKFSRLKKPVDVARASTFELFANPINPLQYDGTALDRILNIYKRDVKKQIYTRNREDVFPISITAVELESAFQSNEAFYTFVSQKWRSIQDSNEIVEYNAIKELINVNVTSGALKTLDVTGMTSEQKLKAVKKIMYGMESPSADYNNYKAISGDSGDPVTTSTPFRSMLMVLGGDLKTDIDVDVLAGVFNLDKATLAENSITVDNFNYNEYDRKNQTIKENHKSNIVGLICDENLFKFTEQLNTSAGMMNPATLTEQTFVHIWQTIAIRAWANCVVLIDNGTEPTPSGGLTFNNNIDVTLPKTYFSNPAATDKITIGSEDKLLYQPTDYVFDFVESSDIEDFTDKNMLQILNINSLPHGYVFNANVTDNVVNHPVIAENGIINLPNIFKLDTGYVVGEGSETSAIMCYCTIFKALNASGSENENEGVFAVTIKVPEAVQEQQGG